MLYIGKLSKRGRSFIAEEAIECEKVKEAVDRALHLVEQDDRSRFIAIPNDEFVAEGKDPFEVRIFNMVDKSGFVQRLHWTMPVKMV